jgi:hypothetical protein
MGALAIAVMQCFTRLQSRPGPLKEDQARFYTASVVLGLEYMQERNIMWRCALPVPFYAAASFS